MKTDENLLTTLIVLFLLASSLLLACRFAGGPGEPSWKVPVGKAAQVLREAADTIERFDTSGDGELDEFEWTAAGIILAAELQRRGADGN